MVNISEFLNCKKSEDATVDIVDKCKRADVDFEDPEGQLKTMKRYGLFINIGGSY